MEWIPVKGMASKRNGLRNGFHQKEWPQLEGLASTRGNGFRQKGMVPNKRNNFH